MSEYLDIRTKKEWRKWLEKNHNKEDSISLLIHRKHTGKDFMTHRESIKEAICFGWIDTTAKSVDKDTYIRKFVKRKETANWSINTLKYAKELIKQKRMTPAGLKAYKLGLKKLPHDHNLPNTSEPSEKLKKELQKLKALEDFMRLAPSYRKAYIRWIERAKLPETKIKRIKQTAEQAIKGKRLGL